MNTTPRLFRPCLIFLLCSLWSLWLCGKGVAGDEKDPYKIRIVLSIARHPLLTSVFREQVARELKDGLQAALGDLARVEVSFHHPKLADVRLHGLAKGLEGWRERSAYKTHFVEIDYNGTAYTIQTRQHDGLLGLTSPVVRGDRTRDRAYVGRTAALLIEQDLGLLGTVESEPDAKRLVRVVLKAGQLGADLGKWVKKDEVFALVRVQGGSPGEPAPWAVLQVEEPATEGVCMCRLFSRYRLPRVTGLRCVLLGTHQGTLRLRLVQDTPGKGRTRLDTPVTLQIRHNGFEGEDATKLQLSTDGSRDVDTSAPAYGTKGVFNRLAFVSVLSGGTLKARIPVPLVDEGLIVLPVPAGNEGANLAAFRFRALQRNVFDSYQVQTEMFKEINALTDKPEQRSAALAKVRRTLERSKEDHHRLRAERDEVKTEIATLPPAERPSLALIDSRLKLIKAGEADLLRHVELLEKIEKEENDPRRKEWLIQVERAKLLEKDGELGQAIAIYEKAPSEFLTPALKTHLADLKRQWDPRDDKHREARTFIFKEWPTLDTQGVIKRMPEAVAALDACKKAGDLIGPARLLLITEKHIQRIFKELEALKPDVNIDDEKPAREIKELTPRLADLVRDIQAYLNKHSKE